MSAGTARALLERSGNHPVVSVFFNLDPSQFATPPARATQARSLLDQAHAESRDTSFDHEDGKALAADLRRLGAYLNSDELPVSGARSLAVFCSARDDLFETIRLSAPTGPAVVIARRPYVEPLIVAQDRERWLIALASRRSGRIFSGRLSALNEDARVEDDVRGKHAQGGWSQANYQRSVDEDAERHLRRIAEDLRHQWQRERVPTVVLGGPVEAVARLRELLPVEMRAALHDGRLELDPETASVDDVCRAVRPILTELERGHRHDVLQELAEAAAAGGPGVIGLNATLETVAEQRVRTLVLAPEFRTAGAACPRCGLLTQTGIEFCPVDGTRVVAVADLREALVEAAVLQDAEVLALEEPDPDLTPLEGIGALLRF